VRHRHVRPLAWFVVGGLLSGPVVPVRSGAEGLLEEIIVTAQRRPERLYTVPVSITVVDSESLHANGARDLSAVAAFAPNMSFDGVVTAGGSTATSVYIRGIGQSDMLQTTDPGVGLFVDGVYVARAVGSLLDVADVERIEVLRGPQGTLFGRNTIGGAINVITQAPGDQLALRARTTLGADERVDSFLSLDAPLSAHVRSRLSFATFDQDGYVSRPNAGDRLGNKHSRVARSQIVYSPGDTFSLAFAGDYTRVRERGVAATLTSVIQTCPAGVRNSIGGCDRNAAPGAAPSQAFLFNNVPPVNRAAGGQGPGISIYDERYVPADPYVNYGAGPERSELDLWGASVTLDWKLPAVSFRSISAWRTFDAFFIRDLDAAPFGIVTPIFTVEQRQASEELQIFNTAKDTQVDWLAGMYYLDEQADDDSDFITASLTTQSGGKDIISRTAAIFGQAQYRINKTIALTGGMRYTDERKFYTPTQYFVSSVTGTPPAGLVIVPAVENKLDFSKTTYRAAVEFTPVEDLLLYASWSTGFKSGGFVQRNQIPRPLLPAFEPETVEVIEIGAKTTVLDGKLRLSAAAFTSDYENMHIRVIEPLTIAPITANAGDARIRGGELEFEAAPHALVRLRGGIGYLDGRYQRIAPTVPDLTLDSKLTDSPEWSANMSVIATLPWLRHSLSGRIDWSYRSSQYNDAENTPDLKQDAFHLLNASATWRCASCSEQLWSATLGVRNLTDEHYLIAGNSLAVQGPITANYARPREWFVTLAVDL